MKHPIHLKSSSPVFPKPEQKPVVPPTIVFHQNLHKIYIAAPIKISVSDVWLPKRVWFSWYIATMLAAVCLKIIRRPGKYSVYGHLIWSCSCTELKWWYRQLTRSFYYTSLNPSLSCTLLAFLYALLPQWETFKTDALSKAAPVVSSYSGETWLGSSTPFAW